jgi:acetyl-CoA C-acetyltransferase
LQSGPYGNRRLQRLLKAIPAADLGATVVRETLKRSRLDPAAVGSVVLGNVIQAGNKMNPARQASIGGGLPVSVPAMTVNRCAAPALRRLSRWRNRIAAGEIDAGIAGGMENMDRAPYLMDGDRWGYRMGPAEIHDSMLRDPWTMPSRASTRAGTPRTW